MEKRIRWIDVAKGIAIICIVLGHLANRRINSIVFTFHVPLFFFVSGYFMSKSGTVVNFVKKKAKTLLLPYAVTCGVICLASVPLNLLQGADWKKELAGWLFASLYGAGNTFTEPVYIPQIGAIWFLPALFWSMLLMRILDRQKAGTRICLVVIIFVLSVRSASYIWLPFSIQAGGCALLFVYFGYLCRQLQPQISRLLKVSGEADFVLALFFVANWIWAIKNYEGLFLARAVFTNGVYDFWGSICGTIVVLMFSKIISDRGEVLPNVLALAGRYSMLIMCVHVLELNLIPWEKVFAYFQTCISMSDDGFISFVMLGKFLFILCGVAVALRVPWIRSVFGYGKVKER